MNKLMIAAAAALCATVTFADGIASANVVGYSRFQLESLKTDFRILSFQNVGAATAVARIGDIVVPGEQTPGEEDWWFAGENNDYIATLGANGALDKCYTWNPYHNSNKGCWVECEAGGVYPDPGYVVADDVTIPMNQAIIVFSAKGAALTLSGAVLTGDNAFYMPALQTVFTGNFSPASFTLGDIVVPGEQTPGEEDWWFAGENNDYISTIGENGALAQCYTWNPYHNDNEGCWVECEAGGVYPDPGYVVANTVSIEPNVALIAFSSKGAVINIPSPLN